MRIQDFPIYSLSKTPGSIGKPRLTVSCECGRTETISCQANMPPDAAAKFFRAKGWDVDSKGKYATCKECQGMATPSTNAIKGQVAATRLIDQYFDIEAGRYEPGWSDERVAAEVGLASSAVTTLRDAGFGPLSVDPALERLGAEILKLEKRYREEGEALMAKLAGFERAIGQDLGRLKLQLAELTKGKKANGRN